MRTYSNQNKSQRVSDFAYAICEANSFTEAFTALQTVVESMGYDGLLYTYIPKILLDSGLPVAPIYELSNGYCPPYIEEYTASRFDKADPIIEMIKEGVKTPINWWGPHCGSYMNKNPKAREVIQAGRHHGIQNGLTIPLLSGSSGIAGASVISHQSHTFEALIDSSLRDLDCCTKLFHGMVMSNTDYKSNFLKSIFAYLSTTEKQYLAGLASGKSPAQIALKIGKQEGYLEQVAIRLRKKLSGVAAEEPPGINRNELMYFAGLVEMLDYSSLD